MELDIPRSGETPLADITGIRFGLLTSTDILKLSVFTEPVLKPKDTSDPRLGLPMAKGRCATCNATNWEDCSGHFAHCRLPTPIFHPHHVTRLVNVLRKVCLNCGQLRKKKAQKLHFLLGVAEKEVDQNVSTPKKMPNCASRPETVSVNDENQGDNEYSQCRPSSARNKRKYASMRIDGEASVERGPADPVVVLSSDEEDLSSCVRKHPKVMQSEQDEDDCLGKGSNPSGRRSWNFRKWKSPIDSTENNSTTGSGSLIDLTHVETWNPLSVVKGGKRKWTDPKQSGVEVVEGIVCAVPRNVPRKGRCKYCAGANMEQYPDILLKVEVKGKDENSSKAIKMEFKVKDEDIDSVTPDFWRFVEGQKKKSTSTVKSSRLLLPSEALTILQKIDKKDFARLGMDEEVARPEGLIVECLPVPPNCLKIQDDAFGTTNLGFKHGIDRASLIFSKLLNKIQSILKTRFGKPSFNAAAVEAGELQALFGLYLREKGAAKAVPGKEKKRTDHIGRVQKRDSRWSLDWLKRHVLGKRSGYSARNVLTGDPFLRVEEIGIPQEVAKYVTIPERVNKLNKDKLQQCVENGQSLTGRYRACGAVRWFRKGNGVTEINRQSLYKVEIGDIVHRHLQDGDLVYVNRPPSLHKHSLLALKAHIQDMAVFTINPAICAPLHADFDGDCLHLFVPQSEECKAELHQLMTIPAQILPSPDAKTILGMSQDNILAAHLLTSTPVFLTKEMMFQMAMCSTRRLPIPAVVKAPGGPLWAGKQVMDMTIPSTFSFRSDSDGVVIQKGELVSYGGKGNWLTSANGLMRALAQQSPQAAVDHLDCAQSALREWLLSFGFSVSLRDFYVAAEHKSRRNMIEELVSSIDHEQQMAVNKELIFDEKFQKLDAIQSDLDATCVEEPKQAEALEDIAVSYFQQQFSEIGEGVGSSIGSDNNLLAMVRSGSKGSLSKVLQQIGCLGLQLYKGEHLLSLRGNGKLWNLASSLGCEEKWEARGLVKSSLLDGLDPLEFYLHAIAVRAGLLRQSLEVTEPGELFKKLMLFLRDIHVAYDGTVRNKFGFEIIQFSYGSVDTQNSKKYDMPGEAVGILAATAIAQPAYQVMLEANHNVGSKKIRPLALLQDTIFPRSGTKLKAADCRITLRLKPCSCNIAHCEERRALRLKDDLQPVVIQTLATATAIQYIPENSEEWDASRRDGVNLSWPWVGHISFDKKALVQANLSMDRVVRLLETSFKGKSHSRVLASGFLGNPKFYFRNSCDCIPALSSDKAVGPCLHFSASLRSTKSKKMVSAKSSKKLVEFVDALRDVMVPLILRTTVKGDDRIESAKIIWEDAAWSPARLSEYGDLISANPNGELVVEVSVQEKLCTTRGAPWNIMKEVAATTDVVDWKRSAPYSVQEVRHAFGVEAARDCILQRLKLATEAGGSTVNLMHLKLVADLMVHAGEVNGISPFGYRDLLRSLKTAAPFTAGAFRAPVKTFMEAGEKGEQEILSGVLASSIFGKRVPVGTGSDFTLQHRPKEDSVSLQMPMDIFDLLYELKEKIVIDTPDSPCVVGAVGNDRESNGWGSPKNADGGSWGSTANGSREEANEWHAPPSKDTDARGWNDGAPYANGDAGAGWESRPSHMPQEVVCAQVKEDGWVGTQGNAEAGDSAWASSPPAETSGWGDGVAVENSSFDISRGSLASPNPKVGKINGWDSARTTKQRDFHPTGANIIPLGKVRQFGTQIADAGFSGEVQTPASGVSEVLGGSCWSAQPVEEAASEWDGKEITADWTLSSTQEGGSEAGWEEVEEKGFIDTDSLWSPPPDGENMPGWSTRFSQNDGGSITGGSCFVSDAARREESKNSDSRKDSLEWRQIIDKVRDARDILQKYEPGAELTAEDKHLIVQILVHHPTREQKVGIGIANIKVAYHMETKAVKPTKCFYVVRHDGTEDDFSYHKCLQNLASQKKPPLDDLYISTFRHKNNVTPAPPRCAGECIR